MARLKREIVCSCGVILRPWELTQLACSRSCSRPKRHRKRWTRASRELVWRLVGQTSAAAVARALGVTDASVLNWFHGRSVPNLIHQEALATLATGLAKLANEAC